MIPKVGWVLHHNIINRFPTVTDKTVVSGLMIDDPEVTLAFIVGVIIIMLTDVISVHQIGFYASSRLLYDRLPVNRFGVSSRTLVCRHSDVVGDAFVGVTVFGGSFLHFVESRGVKMGTALIIIRTIDG